MRVKKDKGKGLPKVASICGTYLKPEMQSIYRQIANLKRFQTTAYAEQLTNDPQFPLDRIVKLEKQKRPRAKGNFILRYWYKHILKQWPAPRRIGVPAPSYYHPYDLIDRLNEDQIDLAHVYYGHKAVKYRKMLESWGKPWIVSFHGVDVVKFFDQEGYPEEMKKVFQQARLVLARSESLLEKLKELGCPEEKLRINRTPIPFGQKSRIVTPPVNQEWVILQACRLIEKKGILTLLDALASLQDKYPKMKYILCGEGPLKSKIEKHASELNVNIVLKGWTSQTELTELYLKSHLFTHPSELTKGSDQEGVPNSMLEAMSYGLPIIATHHGGIPEAVTHNHEGLLAQEKSSEELAENIDHLLSSPEKISILSENASKSVRQKYELSKSIEALEDCYSEALSS